MPQTKSWKTFLPPPEDGFPLFLLSCSYGIFFFWLNLLPYIGDGISEAEEWNLFIFGWITVPPLAVLSALGIFHLKRLYFTDLEIFYPSLLLVNTLFWSIALGLRFVSSQPTNTVDVVWMTLLLLAAHALALLILRRSTFLARPNRPVFSSRIYFSIPLLGSPMLIYFSYIWPVSVRTAKSEDIPIALGFILAIFVLPLLSIFHAKLARMQFSKLTVYVLDGLTLVSTVLLVFNASYFFDQHHYNFYLGPVNDLLHGKSLLVDINCQYGVLPIYLLAALFKSDLFPFTYRGFSCILSILFIAQYFLVYILLRGILKSTAIPILTLLLILAVNFFSQVNHAVLYPSIGPLRFGLAYLLLGATLLRTRYPHRQKLTLALESGIVGIASIWSVEAFFYVAATYIGMVLYESLLQATDIWRFLAHLGRRLVWTASFIAGAHVALTLDILSRSGQWPHWDRYLDYIALYSTNEFGTLPIDPWSAWALISAVYFVSLLALMYRVIVLRDGKRNDPHPIVVGMTFFGIAQFTYYLGRSHPNALYHISIPALLLISYWLTRSTDGTLRIPSGFRSSFAYCIYAILIGAFFLSLPDIEKKWEQTAAYHIAHGEQTDLSLWSMSPISIEVGDAMRLLEKHAKNKERVVLLIHPEYATEALMLSDKVSVFPMSNPVQDNLLESAKKRALYFDHGLRSGDVFFLSNGKNKSIDKAAKQFSFTRDSLPLNYLQFEILKTLVKEFSFTLRDTTDHIYALALQARVP